MRWEYISRSAWLLWPFMSIVGPPAWGEEARLSISGYDPVAYFTDGKPVPGSSEFQYVWHDARWRFASAAHRDLFVGDPNRYAPQYDGYCAGV
jgi:YHS domain